jgi:hypothetical protein
MRKLLLRRQLHAKAERGSGKRQRGPDAERFRRLAGRAQPLAPKLRQAEHKHRSVEDPRDPEQDPCGAARSRPTAAGGGGSQEQDQSAVQESTVVQEDIQIQIDTTDVYVNGEKIEYTAGDTESLKKAFKKKIEELLTDNSSVYIEYENGDYNTYQAVQQVLDDMSIETIQVQEN